jgi:hypothetical protein
MRARLMSVGDRHLSPRPLGYIWREGSFAHSAELVLAAGAGLVART